MIITVTDAHGGAGKSALAGSLAAVRARSGRKVLLLDADPSHRAAAGRSSLTAGMQATGASGLTQRRISGKGLQPELEHLITCYHDIVIEAEARDSLGSRSAFSAARALIVTFDGAGDAEAARQDRLVERINQARVGNPGLRVVIALLPASSGAAAAARRQAAALAGRMAAATCASLDQLLQLLFAEAPAGAAHTGSSNR